MADQLRQLGLAKKTPKKPARKNRRKGAGQPQAKDAGGEISLAAAYSERARDEQRQRDATAREKRRRKALNDALAKLIIPASLNSKDADIDRFFEYAGKIRKIFVTAEQQQALNQGELGIVTFRGGYHLVLPAIVEQVAEGKEEAVAHRPQVADGDELA